MVYDVTGPLLLLVISSRPVESNNKKKKQGRESCFGAWAICSYR